MPGELTQGLEGWHFLLHLHLWGGERGWRLKLLPMASDLINYANVMTLP